MSKQTTPDYLSDEQKVRMQQKLAYFLKKYRSRRGLQSKEMAEKLGYTPTRYGQLESDSKPHPRFIGAINFLASIFSLEQGLTLTEFVNYLDGQSKRVEGDGKTLKRSLLKWELAVLKGLDPVDRQIRKKFLHTCSESSRSIKGKELLEAKLELLNSLDDANKEVILKIKAVVDALRNT